MRPAKTFLISCGGETQADSFTVRSDNLATTITYEGCRSSPSKQLTTICDPFILTVSQDRTKRLISTHIQSLVTRGECVLPAGITCVHSTKDYVAAGAEDGQLHVWRTTDGELVIEQNLHIGGLTKVYIDESLWIIFAASATGRIGAWTLPSLFSSCDPDSLWSIHSLKVTDFAVSCNGRVYSVSHDKTAKCYDYCAGCEIKSENFPTALSCCVLSHSEGILYCGGLDGNVYQVLLSQDFGIQNVIEGHSMEITDLLLSDDDRSLYTASLDMTVRRIETATGQTINHVQTTGIPYALTWMPEIIEPVVEERKQRGKKEAIANRQNAKKGFPKLTRTINPNRDELVSAPVEDIGILSASDELSIAMIDLSNQQMMVPPKTTTPSVAPVVEAKKETDEIAELKRQNAVMFQYILSKQNE